MITNFSIIVNKASKPHNIGDNQHTNKIILSSSMRETYAVDVKRNSQPDYSTIHAYTIVFHKCLVPS